MTLINIASKTNTLISAFKSYKTPIGERRVLSNFNLTIEVGTKLAIMGPNGCGKSTLLRLILGLEKLDSGEICFEITEADRIGAVFQDYRSLLVPWRSVESNLFLPFTKQKELLVSKEEIIASVEDFFEQMGYEISLASKVHALSGGQQQSVVLARALAYKPQFFVWDEATSAIDFSKRTLFYRYVEPVWNRRDANVVFVTHDIDEAIMLGNRIIVVDENMNLLIDEMVTSLSPNRDLGFLEQSENQKLRRRIRDVMLGQHGACSD